MRNTEIGGVERYRLRPLVAGEVNVVARLDETLPAREPLRPAPRVTAVVERESARGDRDSDGRRVRMPAETTAGWNLDLDHHQVGRLLDGDRIRLVQGRQSNRRRGRQRLPGSEGRRR